MKKRILVQLAHPAYEKSRVNHPLARTIRDLAGVTFRDLYESYPDFDVDVRQEQALLQSHEVVVFQHPFYWYSTPALLKEWQDLVLEHGWAYGEKGTALRGKIWLSVVTTGAREEAYCRDGDNRFSMVELLRPIEQTARLCGVDYLPPFVVHGTHLLSPKEIEIHAADYRDVIEALRDDRLDLEAARGQRRLNLDLGRLLGR